MWATEYLKIASISGLPSRERFGHPTDLPIFKPLQFTKQLHEAHRAGRHFDIRLGLPGQGPTLHSWATKKDIPKPGERPILMFQQPLHTGDYATFSGHLHSGYGAGRVHLIEAGEAAVVHASSNKIKLVTLHKGEPEFFTLIRKSPPPSKGTPRQLRTQGGSWLLINTTPVKSHTKN